MKKHKLHLLVAALALLLCLQSATTALAMEGAAPAPTAGPSYTLYEDTTIEEDAAPLAAAPMTEEDCCALHPLLMVAALAVAVYYTHACKQHQQRQFELRASLAQGSQAP